MKKKISKKLKIAVLASCMGMMLTGGWHNNVEAYVGGHQADGGHSSKNLSEYAVATEDGYYELQNSSLYIADTSTIYGNVAIGNFAEAGFSEDEPKYVNVSGTLPIYHGEVPEEDPRYGTNDYSVVKVGDKYYYRNSAEWRYFSGIKMDGKYYKEVIDDQTHQPKTDENGDYYFYEYDPKTYLPKDGNPTVLPGVKPNPNPNPGQNPIPRTTNNTALGNNAKALSYSSVAVGDHSTANGYRGIAIGAESVVGNTQDDADYNDGISAIAIGDGAKAMGNGSIATGQGAQAFGYASIASGAYAGANTTRSIAIGENAMVKYDGDAANDEKRLVAEQAIAIGYNSQANGKDATAVGRQAIADRRNSTAYGNNSHANGWNSVAIGNKAIAGLSKDTIDDGEKGQSTTAVGNRAVAVEEYATALGASTYAGGWHSVAVGDSNRATGRFSTAMGAGWSTYTVDEYDNDNTETDREYASIGANQATGDYSTAVGYGNITTGINSSAFGMQNVASGYDSLAYGVGNKIGTVRDNGATTLQKAQTEGENLGDVTGFAVGRQNKITGQYGGAFGSENTVSGEGSYAIGNNAVASLQNSVALGSGSKTGDVMPETINEIEIPGTNTKYSNISGKTPVGVVSVGDEGAERRITNVAAGRVGPDSTDAINGSELYAVEQQVGGNSLAINNINNRIDKLDKRLNRVGAGAAALAMLHPLDFDPDEKWDFSTGYGHYGNENALALGAFYRPNEDTMIGLGGVLGNGDKMIGATFSWKFGQKNHVSVNRVASAKEIIELRKELNDLRSFMADAVSGNVLDLSKIQLFPDVPENHWAYDYVATLAGNGVIEGYPDGTFDGHRVMTRYEMAGVLYRAMLRGAKLKERALKEFAPELDRIRVDTLTTHKDGSPAIQRVRTIPGKGC